MFMEKEEENLFFGEWLCRGLCSRWREPCQQHISHSCAFITKSWNTQSHTDTFCSSSILSCHKIDGFRAHVVHKLDKKNGFWNAQSQPVADHTRSLWSVMTWWAWKSVSNGGDNRSLLLWPWPLFLVSCLGVVPEELSDTNVALKWEAPEVGQTVSNAQYYWNPVRLGWGTGGGFQECYPCFTHPGSSISTQPNERFMDLNNKGKPLNLTLFLHKNSPKPFLGFDFYQMFIKCASKVTSSWSPLKWRCYWQRYVQPMCGVVVWWGPQRRNGHQMGPRGVEMQGRIK